MFIWAEVHVKHISLFLSFFLKKKKCSLPLFQAMRKLHRRARLHLRPHPPLIRDWTERRCLENTMNGGLPLPKLASSLSLALSRLHRGTRVVSVCVSSEPSVFLQNRYSRCTTEFRGQTSIHFFFLLCVMNIKKKTKKKTNSWNQSAAGPFEDDVFCFVF